MQKAWLLMTALVFSILSNTEVLFAQIKKTTITVLNTYSDNVKKDLTSKLTNVIVQQLGASDKFVIKDRNQLEKVMQLLYLGADDQVDAQKAANIGEKMGSQLVLSSTVQSKNNRFSLNLSVLESVTRVERASYQADYPSWNELESDFPNTMSALIENVFLVDNYFTRNYLFFTQTEATFNRKTTQKPNLRIENTAPTTDKRNLFEPANIDPANFFYRNRFCLSLQGAYNQPVGEYEQGVNSAAYFSLLTDYSLIVTEYFVFSPIVDVQFFYNNADISQTTINELKVLGLTGGLSLTLNLPILRALSFHLRGDAGLAVSFINADVYENGTGISNDPMFTAAFESRYTFFERYSLSLFVSYLAILYSDSTMQAFQAGLGVGYRL